jgi:hypothetical protein
LVRLKVFRRRFSIIFDGTPHCGELLGIVIRYLGDNWVPRQVLVDVVHTDKSLNAAALGGLINKSITDRKVGLNVSMEAVFGAIRDSASLNGSCLDSLSGVMPNNVSVNCVSHCGNRIGQQMRLGKFQDLMTPWNQLFAHSGNVRLSSSDSPLSLIATFRSLPISVAIWGSHIQ